MRLKGARFTGFKRFTDTAIRGLPETARLIVLAGPNGTGKSSIFDGLKLWHTLIGGAGKYGWDETYGTKVDSETITWTERIAVETHEPISHGQAEAKKAVYLRSAFRHEADFNIQNLSQIDSPLNVTRVERTIEADAAVSENYSRLILATINGIYSDEVDDDTPKRDLRDRIIGRVRRSMAKVFPDLLLDGVGIPTRSDAQGTFYFSKGSSKRFLYKNLSAGEKAVFDLLLDAVIKADYFDDSIWCIDEPETHLNTRIQGLLLSELLEIIPPKSQLMLASHSIGFMRRAWDIAKSAPSSVAFINMQDHDFDSPVVLEPVKPSRDFWASTLTVALDDLADLMAPECVVLCEGQPSNGRQRSGASFDASCYRTIFSDEFPEVDFLSVGNSNDVKNERLEAGRAIQTLATGTKILRLVDRDTMSSAEVEELIKNNVQVLSRRHIEAYLLDNEVIERLCASVGKADLFDQALAAKKKYIDSSVSRGNDVDDVKSASGDIYNSLRKLLGLTNAGSDYRSFLRDTMAPLLSADLQAYRELKADIFTEHAAEPDGRSLA